MDSTKIPSAFAMAFIFVIFTGNQIFCQELSVESPIAKPLFDNLTSEKSNNLTSPISEPLFNSSNPIEGNTEPNIVEEGNTERNSSSSPIVEDGNTETNSSSSPILEPLFNSSTSAEEKNSTLSENENSTETSTAKNVPAFFGDNPVIPENFTDELPALMEGRQRACGLFIGIDEPLYEFYERNLTALTRMASDHVDFANWVFGNQVLTRDNGFGDIYFKLAHIQVMFGSCDGFENKNCTTKRDEYLKSFGGKFPYFKDFCLAYVFTYIDFHNGTAGLAHIGTVCRPGPSNVNTGFITLLNFNQTRSMDDSRVAFVHELGHSFGAEHDSEFEDCKGKGFLMTAVDNSTNDSPNRFTFSTCSIESMISKLEEVEGDGIECYKSDYEEEVDVALCGNGVVETGEECDCGEDDFTCDDPCCFPAKISASDRYSNHSATQCTIGEGRDQCAHPTWLVYGIYWPFAVMLGASAFMAAMLYRDWNDSKWCFQHVTRNNIRIVNKRRRQQQQYQAGYNSYSMTASTTTSTSLGSS